MCGLFKSKKGELRRLREGDHLIMASVPEGTQVIFLDENEDPLTEVKRDGRELPPIIIELPYSPDVHIAIMRLITASSGLFYSQRIASKHGRPAIRLGRQR